MSELSIFFNVNIKNINCFSRLGNFCFSPVRYLFNGKTVRPVHGNPTTFEELPRSEKTLLKTICAILLIIPGLLFGSMLKGVSYLSKYVNIQHNSYKKSCEFSQNIENEEPLFENTPSKKKNETNVHTIHDDLNKVIPLNEAISRLFPNFGAQDKSIKYEFKDGNVTLGSDKNRLNKDAIKKTLTKLNSDRIKDSSQKVLSLIIYANDNLLIDEDLGFLDCNPSKLILIGARLIHTDKPNNLDRLLFQKKEWLLRNTKNDKDETTFTMERTFIEQLKVNSVEDALKDIIVKNQKKVFLVRYRP